MTIKIEKNIPYPSRHKPNEYRDAFDLMEDGDSFVVKCASYTEVSRVRSSLLNAIVHIEGKYARTRFDKDLGELRIWCCVEYDHQSE